MPSSWPASLTKLWNAVSMGLLDSPPTAFQLWTAGVPSCPIWTSLRRGLVSSFWCGSCTGAQPSLCKQPVSLAQALEHYGIPCEKDIYAWCPWICIPRSWCLWCWLIWNMFGSLQLCMFQWYHPLRTCKRVLCSKQIERKQASLFYGEFVKIILQKWYHSTTKNGWV